ILHIFPRKRTSSRNKLPRRWIPRCTMSWICPKAFPDGPRRAGRELTLGLLHSQGTLGLPLTSCDPCLDNRRFSLFVDQQLKDIRPRVVANHVEIKLGLRQLAAVDLCHQNGLLFEIRPCDKFSERIDNATASSGDHRLRLVSE